MEICTNEAWCGCPHIFEFLDEHGIEIGELRYRWGHFQLWPIDVGADLDNIIDVRIDKEMGILPYDKKNDILEYCTNILLSWYDNEELPDDRNEYIKNLLED